MVCAVWSRVQIPAGVREFSLLRSDHTDWGFVLGLKRLRGEVNYSLSSCAIVKNELSCKSVPPVCLHGMNREDLAFFNFHVYTS